VIATGIMNESDIVQSLFDNNEASEKEHRITTALDAINRAYGDGTLKLAVQGSGRIKTTSEKQSPHYTTRWSDLPTVSVK
jgi:DNA polymerase V